jgi:hypothetical protein
MSFALGESETNAQPEAAADPQLPLGSTEARRQQDTLSSTHGRRFWRSWLTSRRSRQVRMSTDTNGHNTWKSSLAKSMLTSPSLMP